MVGKKIIVLPSGDFPRLARKVSLLAGLAGEERPDCRGAGSQVIIVFLGAIPEGFKELIAQFLGIGQ
ncbi:MAG: hypothetical protein M1127_00425 [Patescibacteria group bacterium]|nr:hypothetical protein [Patescibacteria group bacterium]